MIKLSGKAFPNNKKVIDEIMRKIANIQNENVIDKGYKKIKELIEKLNDVWLNEEKYWF